MPKMRIRSSQIVGVLLVLLLCCRSQAGVVFQAPVVDVVSDGVNPTSGTFFISLGLSGADAVTPPTVGSFNVDISVGGSEVTFGLPTYPSSNPLFASAANFFAPNPSSPQTAQAAHDGVVAALASDGANLIEVPFTIDAGVDSGSFPLTFNSGNELTDAAFQPIALDAPVAGSINVTAIPEPSALAYLGLIVGLVAGVHRVAMRCRSNSGREA